MLRMHHTLLPACLAIMMSWGGARAAPMAHALVPIDSTRLGLPELLRRTLDRNPSLAVATAAWQASQARVRAMAALEPPSVEVAVAPASFGSATPAWRVGVSQAVPLFGQRGLRVRGAAAATRAAAHELLAVQLDLLHDARTSYYAYWGIVRAMDLTTGLRALVQEFRRAALARYTAGLVAQQDPLRADAELAMLDHRLDLLERERLLIVARLNTLMHEPADAPLPPPVAELMLPDTTIIHPDLRAQGLEARPELKAAEARIEVARADLALARRNAWPEPQLGLAYDRFWSEQRLRPSVSLGWSLPWLTPGPGAQHAEAAARLAEREAQRDVVRDSVALQVEEAATRLHELVHDLSISRERLVPLAERTVRASRAGYESGKATFVDLIQSERDLLQARLEADQTLAMLHQARADLDRALGIEPLIPKEVRP